MARHKSKLLVEVQKRYPQIERVVDAKIGRKIQFAAFEEDCRLGKPESPGGCSGAIALSRAIGMPVLVRRWVTLVIGKRIATRYLNSKPLADEVYRLDRHKQFRPGLYAIIAPSAKQRLDRMRPGPTERHGSHPHKGPSRLSPRNKLRQSWAEPTPELAPVYSMYAQA